MTGGSPANGAHNGILDLMERMIGERGLPVPMERSSDPFHVLVSTIISLRTRDAVTSMVSAVVLEHAPDPVTMLEMEPAELEALLRPAGFFRQKAAQLRRICAILLDRHDGRVPATMEELMELPGVGLKTASFMMGMVFGEPAVCVDVHVHRIANRIGLVSTGTPEQSKAALEALFPLERWTGINHIMVRFGQEICRPIRPLCGSCRLQRHCVHAGGTAKR